MKLLRQNSVHLTAMMWAVLCLTTSGCKQVFQLEFAPKDSPTTVSDDIPKGDDAARSDDLTKDTDSPIGDEIPKVAMPIQDPGPVVCDPFSPANVVSPKSGLSGELRYAEPNVGPSYRSVFDFKQNGQLIDATLFLNELNVIPRRFENGFSADGGSALQDGSGNTLFEYFSVHVKSNIILDARDQEGRYQFALLADDGAVMSVLDPVSNSYQALVKNDGLHAPRLACGDRAVSMYKSTRLGTEIDYFQGPRYHIALMLLWRPVSDQQADVLDPLCQNVSPPLARQPSFFDTNFQPSKALPDYDALLSRGWKPVPARNFLLQEGTNLCAQQSKASQ